MWRVGSTPVRIRTTMVEYFSIFLEKYRNSIFKNKMDDTNLSLVNNQLKPFVGIHALKMESNKPEKAAKTIQNSQPEPEILESDSKESSRCHLSTRSQNVPLNGSLFRDSSKSISKNLVGEAGSGGIGGFKANGRHLLASFCFIAPKQEETYVIKTLRAPWQQLSSTSSETFAT